MRIQSKDHFKNRRGQSRIKILIKLVKSYIALNEAKNVLVKRQVGWIPSALCENDNGTENYTLTTL